MTTLATTFEVSSVPLAPAPLPEVPYRQALEGLLAGQAGVGNFGEDGPSPGAFPGGLSRAPFTWDYLGQALPMEFLGGFVGVRQDADLALRPEIGWAVRRA